MIYCDTTLQTVYLKPGEIYFTDRPAVVSTVLGSCVSITMFVPSSGISGICHGLLPACKNAKVENCSNGRCQELYKYVDCSIHRMIEKIDAYGMNRAGVQAKLFGGAEMMSSGKRTSWKTVGHENILTAARIIQSEGFNIAAYDVGGIAGRKIYFNTATGEVFLKRLNKSKNSIYCDESGSTNRSSNTGILNVDTSL